MEQATSMVVKLDQVSIKAIENLEEPKMVVANPNPQVMVVQVVTTRSNSVNFLPIPRESVKRTSEFDC